jgi:hypothetical protein
MDWVTLTKQEVEADALPEICIVSGAQATARFNHTFRWVPEWVQYLYWLGGLPGVIATAVLKREMRVSCPVCSKERATWRSYEQLRRGGWLIGLLLAVSGALFAAIWSSGNTQGVNLGAVGIGTSVGLGSGLLVWWLSLLTYSQGVIRATKITEQEIHLVGVADAFVKAVQERRRQGSGMTSLPLPEKKDPAEQTGADVTMNVKSPST